MKNLLLLTIGILMVLALVACGAASGSEPQISAEDAWSRSSPVQMGNGAIFMTLKNSGGSDDALIGGETDVAKVVEIHETKMEGDMMKMSPVEKIVVPAGGMAELKPGGLHVMLIELNKELVLGETVSLTLNFEKSDPITVEAEIRDMGGMK